MFKDTFSTDTLQIQHTTDTAQAQIQHTKAWEQKSGIRIASQLGTAVRLIQIAE